ncbi:MAG: serine protease [Pirellulaceae bacterium]|nr:serine protease [Pirellulaceae bacterium]
MFRYPLVFACVATWASCTCAILQADQLPPNVLSKVKQATVFIRASTADGESQGTGFFVAEHMVVTNAHVLGMKDAGASKPRKLSLVLNSGSGAKEKTVLGEVVFADTTEDLAFVKLDRQASVTPLELVPSEEVLETLPVHIVGYPLGAALTAGNNPAVTVANGSVSSIRRNQYSQIEELQIDGSIIPGNSGGPIVDAKGRLVGVSVATLLGTHIGFSIPADSVRADMEGRVTSASLTHQVIGQDSYSVDARIRVIDPMGRIGSVAIYYWFCPVGAQRPLDAEGKFPTHGAQGDSPKKHIKLTFNRSTGEWTGSIPKFTLREDQDIWIQPAIANGKKVRLTGALNHSADMRKKNQNVASAPGPSKNLPNRLDRLRGSNPGDSNRSRGVTLSPKLGKSVPRKLIEPIKNDNAPIDAKIDRDDHGYRYTHVQSSAEKIVLGPNRLIQMVTDPTGHAIYAIFEGEASVKVFDTKDMSLAGEIPVAKDPVSIWCDDSRIVVACDKSKLVAIIDSDSYETKKVMRLPNRELVPGRLPGVAPDGSIMSLWKSNDAARWDTFLYLLREDREPIEFAKGDIEWCAFTGFKDYLWTQHNFRGSPSGAADLMIEGKPNSGVLRQPVFSSFGGLHRDIAHSFPTFDGNGFVVPISAHGMPGAWGYATKTMVVSSDLSQIKLWIPGSVICEVPGKGFYVSWQTTATQEKSDGGPEILYASASNGRIIRRISVSGLSPHPAGFAVRNAIPNIVYVPGREYFLFHDMNSRTGEIELVRCGPIGSEVEVSPDPSLHSHNDPPQIAYVGKPLDFTPSFDPPQDARAVTFRLKKGVQGLQVDSKSGKLSFNPTETNVGLYDIELVADVDGIEVPVLKWTLEVDIAP